MELNAKNRYQAFGIHFLVSFIIVLSVALLVLYVWYTEPFLTAEGAWSVLGITILVNVMVGPMLTLVVYKPGKKGMKFDLVTISSVQLVALVYGCAVLYAERPMYMVFSVDRFVVVSVDNVDYDKIQFPELKEKSIFGPKLVYAKMPTDPEERIRFGNSVMNGEPDLEFRSEYYHPFLPNLEKVLTKGKAKAALSAKSENHNVDFKIFEQQHCPDGCAYFPLVGKKKDMLIAISKSDGSVVGAMDLDPWV